MGHRQCVLAGAVCQGTAPRRAPEFVHFGLTAKYEGTTALARLRELNVSHIFCWNRGVYQGTPSGAPLVTANRAALAAALGDQGLIQAVFTFT